MNQPPEESASLQAQFIYASLHISIPRCLLEQDLHAATQNEDVIDSWSIIHMQVMLKEIGPDHALYDVIHGKMIAARVAAELNGQQVCVVSSDVTYGIR